MKYIAVIIILLTLSFSSIADENIDPCPSVSELYGFPTGPLTNRFCTQPIVIFTFKFNEETGECDLDKTLYSNITIPCAQIGPMN